MKAKSMTPRLTGSPSIVPGRGRDGVGVAGLGQRLLEARRVVRKARAGRWSGGRSRSPRSCPRRAGARCTPRPNAAVIVAVRADVQVPLELLADVRVPAGLALLPGVRRDLQPFAPRLPRLLLLRNHAIGTNVTGSTAGQGWQVRARWTRASSAETANASPGLAPASAILPPSALARQIATLGAPTFRRDPHQIPTQASR